MALRIVRFSAKELRIGKSEITTRSSKKDRVCGVQCFAFVAVRSRKLAGRKKCGYFLVLRGFAFGNGGSCGSGGPCSIRGPFGSGGPCGRGGPCGKRRAFRQRRALRRFNETKQPHGCLVALSPCGIVALRPCCLAALLPCGLVALRPCCLAALLPFGLVALRPEKS